MFEIRSTTSHTLVHSQSRIENHGDKKMPALDVRLRLKAPNHALDLVCPGLREALMVKGQPDVKPDDAQGKLNLNVDERGKLAFPSMKYPLKFDIEHQGHTLEVEHGTNDKLRLTLCKVHNFQITPVAGGSCEIEYTVSSSAGIDEHLIGAFGVKAQTDVALTLKAAEVRQEDLIDGKKRKGRTPEQALAQTQP
jgi:hypothetical protein